MKRIFTHLARALAFDHGMNGVTAKAFLILTAVVLALLAPVPAEATVTVTTLANFHGPDGSGPYDGLIWGGDGYFYGTTFFGGTYDEGTIFKVTPAGELTTLYSFDGTNGATPFGLVRDPDGNFYGLTQTGGTNLNVEQQRPYGTVFRVTPAGVLSSIFSFNGENGYWPFRTLTVGPDGYLYGCTQFGGADYGGITAGNDGYSETNDMGTIFKISTDGTFHTLYSFAGAGGFNGFGPSGKLLVGPDQALYGETAVGSNCLGVIYRITTNGDFSVSAKFDISGTNGASPNGGLTLGTDGSLYGVAGLGEGTTSWGTIFKLSPDNILSNLFTFTPGQGYGPEAQLLLGPDGNFYGTTQEGGTGNFNGGVLFQISPGGAFTDLYNFFNPSESHPEGSLVAGPDGNFYGTTYEGGSGGTIFRVTGLAPSISGPTDQTNSPGDVAIFRVSVNGVGPLSYQWRFNGAPLVDDGRVTGTDGTPVVLRNVTPADAGVYTVIVSNVFGVATNQATLSIFISPPVQSIPFDRLYSFTNGASGEGGLVLGANNTFYGPNVSGGNAGKGSIFQFTRPNSLADVLQFNSTNGVDPMGSLIQGTDGNLYGIAYYGGLRGAGNVYRMTPAGVATELAGFDGSNGAFPRSGLAMDAQGNLYGTTSQFGAYDWGTVFQVTPAGVLTTLGAFDYTNSGALPLAPLVLGNDGNMYGTTAEGGPGGMGTIFQITPAGTLTTLAAFNGANGATPLAGLIVGADGNFYGTASAGGAYNFGNVFRMTPEGALQTLFDFNMTNGAAPAAELVLGGNGNFFGTTTAGGEALDLTGDLSSGTVFEMTPAGILTTLITFLDPRGASPDCALVAGNDGYYYGRTAQGGDAGLGTIYRFPIDAPFIITQPTGQTAPEGSSITLHVVAGGATPLNYQWQRNSTNLSAAANISGVTNADLTLNSFSATDTGIYSVIVRNAAGAVTSAGAVLAIGAVSPVMKPPLAVNVTGGQLIFDLNGVPGATFKLLSADGLGTSPGSWTPRVTGSFDSQGHFSISITPDPTKAQQFFVLQTP